jgi:diadenosine tetraphosphate (Ap4A) HIT family hydrolase
MADECPRCATVAGRSSTPGGIVHDDGLWLVVHHPGSFADPGELLVILRRHAETLGDLTDAEAAALGPVLRGGVGVIERVVKPQRVYAASYNERVRHVHFFLLPRTAALPAGHVTSDLFRRARGLLRGWGLARNPSPAERAEAATRMRSEGVWPRTRD